MSKMESVFKDKVNRDTRKKTVFVCWCPIIFLIFLARLPCQVTVL